MSRRASSALAVLATLAVVACGPTAAVIPQEINRTRTALLECCSPPDSWKFTHSPFGLHAAAGRVLKARELNAHFVRKIVLWQQGEPQPGQYRIAGGDSSVRMTHAAGLELVVTLRTTSRWGIDVDYDALVKEKPQHPWTRFSGPPRDMDAWLAFVREVVERYDGDGDRDMPGLSRPIRYWQIGNEIRWQWQGTLDQYLDLLKQTAATIRAADPQAQIILGALTDALEIAKADLSQGSDSRTPAHLKTVSVIDQVLQQGADDYDIVDFHAYDDDPYGLAQIVCWLRKRIDPSKAIWSLENAGPFDDFTTARFSEDLVKRHLVMLACGVEGIFWSSLTPTIGWSEPYLRLALLDESGRATPAYDTYRLMTSKLLGMTSVQLLETPAGLCAFQVNTPRGEVIVAWSDHGEIDWKLPLEAPAAQITHIVTDPHARTPHIDRVPTNAGTLSVRISSPVFIERVAH